MKYTVLTILWLWTLSATVMQNSFTNSYITISLWFIYMFLEEVWKIFCFVQSILRATEDFLKPNSAERTFLPFFPQGTLPARILLALFPSLSIVGLWNINKSPIIVQHLLIIIQCMLSFVMLVSFLEMNGNWLASLPTLCYPVIHEWKMTLPKSVTLFR